MGTGKELEGLAEQMTVKQRGDEQASGKNFPGNTMSKCKDSEVGTSFVMFGDSKEAGGAGAGWASRKVLRDEVREERETGQLVRAKVEILELLRGRWEVMSRRPT